MISRLTALAATATVALLAAAPAFASTPYWTQKPELFLQGNRLFASNGGWSADSGTPTKVLYRFLRDGVVVQGLQGEVPKSTPPSQTLPGVYPDDPGAPYYVLGSADSGHCFTAEVWGGIRSTYHAVDGTLVFDAWEWGHLNSFGVPAVTNQICVGGGTPPPPPAPPPPPTPVPPSPPNLVIAPQILRGGRANVPYSQRLTVSGATAAFTYTVASGALPKGMTLSADGMLEGVPDAAAGDYTFSVVATDGAQLTTSLNLVFTVLPPRMRFESLTALTAAVRGRAYRADLVVLGGSEPYSFTLVAGSIPPGLRLGLHGALAGRPARTGNFGFKVEATDANGVVRRHYYTLRVRKA